MTTAELKLEVDKAIEEITTSNREFQFLKYIQQTILNDNLLQFNISTNISIEFQLLNIYKRFDFSKQILKSSKKNKFSN